MTPVLLLDMDGPLADFDRRCFEICAESGWPVDVEGLHAQTARYMTDHVIDTRHRRWLRRLIDEWTWFEELPVTPGAQEGVDALLATGVDVWVVTKPLEVNPTCRDGKAKWLRQHFPMLERKLIIAPDKSLILGDILLDDAPKLEWIARACWDPWIFAAPFNGPGSEWADLPRWSWGDPIDRLLALPRPSTEGDTAP